MEALNNHLLNIWYILLNFIGGFIIGFISIIVAMGVCAFYYGTTNRFSVSFMAGSFLGAISFICVLAGLPILFFL